jgi:hypothetical protein
MMAEDDVARLHAELIAVKEDLYERREAMSSALKANDELEQGAALTSRVEVAGVRFLTRGLLLLR